MNHSVDHSLKFRQEPLYAELVESQRAGERDKERKEWEGKRCWDEMGADPILNCIHVAQ